MPRLPRPARASTAAVLALACATTMMTTMMPATTATAAEPDRTVSSFWLHMNSTPTTDAMLETEAQRRDYVVLNAWEGDLVRKLKAANPAVQVFVYKDLSSTRSYACRDGVDDTHLPTGVGYCAADPDWFLRGPDGQRFEYSGYDGHWQMDVGHPAYQNAWADNVVAASTAAGFDGVFMDNALFTCDAYHEDVCPRKYPTDAEMREAYRSMLANTREKFTTAGLKTVANLSNARLHEGAWDAYTEHLDGAFDEWWLTFADDHMLPEYGEGWSRQVAQIASNEARGKITWVQPHFTEGADRPFRYALASYLMAAGDKAAFAEVARTDGYGDPTPWHPEYDWDLGAPTGPYHSVATNVFRRDFTCGAAVVNANPTDSAAVTVSLGGEYIDENSKPVTSVSLPGTSGSVLRKSC
ncbi:MAG TPA: putative glycoside hydrolase [Actinophytocola sp.]|nr:putative glycoside hydrolase [Actinophytocola sp.]